MPKERTERVGIQQVQHQHMESIKLTIGKISQKYDDLSSQRKHRLSEDRSELAVDSRDAVQNGVKRSKTSPGDRGRRPSMFWNFDRRTRLPSSTSVHRTDIDENKEASLVEAVLHTKEQRKASKDLVEKLRKEGKHCQHVSCSDISWFLTTDMRMVSNIHLIVDTLMYRMLMKDGRLREDVYSKFKELDNSDKRIFVLNTLQTEFNDLFHHIPPNARILLNELSTGQSSEGDVTKTSGMTGGSSKDSIVTGTVNGNMCNVYGNFFNVNAGEKFEISSTRIKDKNGPSVTIGQGAHPNATNQLVITTDAENNQEVFDEVTNNKDKLLSDHVQEVETEIGSVIIKLTVDKTHIMTDTWIQTVLKTIFYDILRDFFNEGTKFHVTVERHICIGEEEFLNLYSSYQSHDDCVPKTEFDSLKSKLEEMMEKHGKCNSTNERSLNIKQEPLDEEYEQVGGKPVSRKQLEGKPFCETLLEKKQLKREAFEGKPFDKELMEGKPPVGNPPEGKTLYETDLKGLDWKYLDREQSLEGKPIETLQSFKMRKFQKMNKVDPEMDMKGVEVDHLLAELQSLYAEVDYMRETQTLKTETYPGGRTYGKKGLKMFGYEDVVIDPEQKAVLQKACGICLVQTLQDLITSGSLDINHCNRKGMSLVMVSALKGDKDIFDLLVKNGCSLMDHLPNGDNILHLACLGGNADIVDFILNCNILGIESKGMYGRTPVMKAAGAGQKEVFDLLVRKGCRLNVVGKDHNKLIHVACMGDNVQIVKFLLEDGHADIESSGMFKRTPVMIAASLGKKRVFDLLVRHGCDLDVKGADENNLLHVACMGDCVEIVHFLISQAQVDMEAREIYGKTPVMIAAERGNRRVFDLLVRKGCDLLVEDSHGNNILHAAVKGGNLQIINDILLELHLDPDSKNYFGQTANSLAVAHSQVQVPQRYN